MTTFGAISNTLGFSGSKEFFSGEYVNPAIASYYAYECCYCQKYFYLVQSRDFQAGGCKRTVQYRNKETGEIKAAENRSEGILYGLYERNNEKTGMVKTEITAICYM